MGYYSPISYITNYQLGDTLLISNDDETSTNSSSYVLAKTIEIGLKTYLYSAFKIDFEIKGALGGAANFYQAYLTHNGATIGTVQGTGDLFYTNKSQEIESETWLQGDTISIYCRNNSGGNNDVFIRNFKIYGLQSPFYNTKKVI